MKFNQLFLMLIIIVIFPLDAYSNETYEYPDIFALEEGNQWTYTKNMNGVVSEITETVNDDSNTFSMPTFRINQSSTTGGSSTNTWYLRATDAMVLKSISVDGVSITFLNSTGLIEVWHPCKIGQTRFSTATGNINWLSYNIDLSVTVVSLETITVPAGTFQAYKLQCTESTTALFFNETNQYSIWVIPYLPILKYDCPDKGYVLELSSFKIKGGSVDITTDTDGDALMDYEELTIYHTHPAKKDTDNDGIDDPTEIANNTDPIRSDIHGDVNNNGRLDLTDLMIILKFLSDKQ